MAVNQVFKNQLIAIRIEIDAVLINVIDSHNYFPRKFLFILIRGPNLTENEDLTFIANNC